MKQTIYTLFVLTLLSVSALQTAAQERSAAKGAERSADRSAERSADKGADRQNRRDALRSREALLHFECSDFDLGDIARRGGEVTTTVPFRNDGTAPLVIIRVTTTCSCLKCDYSKRPVPVGGQGEIRLTYQPLKADPGTFHKVVHILSNSSSGREIITIRGNSLDK